MKKLTLILVFVFTQNVFAHGGGEGAGAQVGPDKGITEKGPNGFKLSTEAIKTIGFKTLEIQTSLEVPKEAIVTAKDEKSFYRIRDGWYKRIPLDKKELQAKDQIVISQLGFLRVIEIYAQGEEETEEHND